MIKAPDTAYLPSDQQETPASRLSQSLSGSPTIYRAGHARANMQTAYLQKQQDMPAPTRANMQTAYLQKQQETAVPTLANMQTARHAHAYTRQHAAGLPSETAAAAAASEDNLTQTLTEIDMDTEMADQRKQ